MSSYVSLLRGINVSGQKKVNMKELKALYESIGLSNVTTYIQSGNVVFTCEEHCESTLKEIIESEIEKHYSFYVPVLILAETKLTDTLKNLPFDGIIPSEQGSQTLFSFLSESPEQKDVVALNQYKASSEQVIAIGSVVYLYCPNGYGKTKLTNTLLERKLKVSSTTRNLKTVIKLQSILLEINSL
jgi:uncharacterized protein (DUF1697 family)